MVCVKRSKVGQFNAHVKRAQIDNSLSYCILHRSEQASNTTGSKGVEFSWHFQFFCSVPPVLFGWVGGTIFVDNWLEIYVETRQTSSLLGNLHVSACEINYLG